MPATKAFLRALRKKHHLGEFRTVGKRKRVGRKRKIYTKKTRRFSTMAKRRSHRRSSGGMFGFGGGGIMKGIVKPRGILADVILGAGAATLTENLVGKPLGEWTGVAAGFAVGGLGGAAGAYGRSLVKGILGGTTGTAIGTGTNSAVVG